MDNKEKKKLTLKQRSWLYFHKSKQYFNNQWYIAKKKIKNFIDSFYFYLIIFIFFLFFIHKVLLFSDVTITEDSLRSLAFAVASIIGASIAIVFLFSTLILQSTADLFSTQYLNKFIQDVKEKVFFWLLVFLTIASFFTPIFLKNYNRSSLFFIFK